MSRRLLDDISQITLIGTGLLGASVTLGLKARGYKGRIIGVGRRQSSADEALRRGAVDEAVTDAGPAVRKSGLVIVAVPLGNFETVFRQIAPHDHDDLVITDVGSTKLSVLAAAKAALPEPSRFVGSHPMAGSEQQGAAAADPNLCAGKPCIVTPADDTRLAALAVVEELWQRLGMKLIRMTPQEHDAQAAVISHLPHAVSVLLVQVAKQCGGWDIASTGFRDTTRLASSNPPMRADILEANRAQVVAALKTFRGELDQFTQMLERGDRDGLLELLQSCQSMRESWLRSRDASAEETEATS